MSADNQQGRIVYEFHYIQTYGPGKTKSKSHEFTAIDDNDALKELQKFIDRHYENECVRTGADFNQCQGIVPQKLERGILVADMKKLMQILK